MMRRGDQLSHGLTPSQESGVWYPPRSIPVVDELRHLPAKPDRQEAKRQPHGERDQCHQIRADIEAQAADIDQAGDDGDAGVQLGAKQQRHVIAQHVAQHAADAARDHAGDDDDGEMLVALERDVTALDGEHHKTDGVEHEKQIAKAMDHRRQRNGRQRRRRGDGQQIRLLHPGQRIIAEQHVASRTTAQRGDAAEQRHADPIHAAPPRRQCRRHRCRDQADDGERKEELFGMGHEGRVP